MNNREKDLAICQINTLAIQEEYEKETGEWADTVDESADKVFTSGYVRWLENKIKGYEIAHRAESRSIEELQEKIRGFEQVIKKLNDILGGVV